MSEPARAADPTSIDEPATPEELAAQWEAEKPPAAGPAANVAAAAVVVLLGIFGIISAVDMGVGSAESPEAGTWPLVISVVITVLGVLLAVTARRIGDAEKFSSASWLVLLGLATMVGFALVVGTIGFEIPGILLAFVWLKVLGREKWRTSVIAAVAIVAAFYLIFVIALGTSIPHLF
ncbi:MAG TPA: tripartite tricarboxylate transporter TctB family protein [Microlunatus sp.]